MKLIYSVLKNQFLPNLDVDSKTLANDLAMIGHFVSNTKTIDGETIFDLEIRQNRGDCLGYYGLARDISVLYNIPLVTPKTPQFQISNYQLPIKVTSANVKRLTAIKITNLKTSSSPPWLARFLQFHDINSINNIVDATNYIMLLWGIPNHAFDIAKSSENLIWEDNQQYSEFITLDGTNLKLHPDCLLISNGHQPLSLTFIGGQFCAVNNQTTDIIIEAAVYNRSRVKTDSRLTKTITEAEIRLDKELDTETILQALNHLATLICDLCHGHINSQLFDYYPQKPTPPQIPFDPLKPSLYSGIDIPQNDILKRLGCVINNNLVTPPSIRKDITIEEDLIEEVIRFHGYQKIPASEPLVSKQLPDITPKVLYLIEKLKDDLINQGYDEVRSWPLVQKPLSSKAVYTQNSINSEYPVLRESIIQSLENQLDQYNRYKLPNPKFFEIGKIYYQENGKYIEKYALGTYDGHKFSETILDDLDKPETYTPKDISSSASELTSQIITLDANVTSTQDPETLTQHYTNLIDPKILWSINVVDHYQDKYTFRVSYYNCTDKTAKKTHLSAFGLTNGQNMIG